MTYKVTYVPVMIGVQTDCPKEAEKLVMKFLEHSMHSVAGYGDTYQILDGTYYVPQDGQEFYVEERD
jgi:hypothetical protein